MGSSAASPHRITLVITSLEAGGAERVLSNLANAWADAGRAVTLITLHGSKDDFYTLAPQVKRVVLDVLRASRGRVDAVLRNVTRIARLRRAIRESAPDAVVAFTDQTNVLTLLATRGLGVPVVVSERTNPENARLGRLWTLARRWTYPLALAVVVQTEAVREWAQSFVPAARVVVIPNAVSPDDPTADAASEAPLPFSLPRHFVAGMGRLERRKGFDVLLRSFAKAAGKNPEWHLVILGEGPERAALVSEARRLGVADRVHLPGRVTSPSRVLRRAEIFVLSSEIEGFPNALLEAMSCGCASVSFDCPYGPSDIISHNTDGLLLAPGSESALADTLRGLMMDPAYRARLGAAARRVTERFSPSSVVQAWERVLRTCS